MEMRQVRLRRSPTAFLAELDRWLVPESGRTCDQVCVKQSQPGRVRLNETHGDWIT